MKRPINKGIMYVAGIGKFYEDPRRKYRYWPIRLSPRSAIRTKQLRRLHKQQDKAFARWREQIQQSMKHWTAMQDA